MFRSSYHERLILAHLRRLQETQGVSLTDAAKRVGVGFKTAANLLRKYGFRPLTRRELIKARKRRLEQAGRRFLALL